MAKLGLRPPDYSSFYCACVVLLPHGMVGGMTERMDTWVLFAHRAKGGATCYFLLEGEVVSLGMLACSLPYCYYTILMYTETWSCRWLLSLSSLGGMVQAGKIIIEEGLFPPGVCLNWLNPCLGACLMISASLPSCVSQLVCLCGGQGTAFWVDSLSTMCFLFVLFCFVFLQDYQDRWQAPLLS